MSTCNYFSQLPVFSDNLVLTYISDIVGVVLEISVSIVELNEIVHQLPV